MSLEDTIEKIEWRKRMFEYKLKNTHRIEKRNAMAHKHDDKVNKIAECNLLHYIINPHKCTKILNIY